MQAVILAAGRGVRMGDMTRNTPKPLLKINNQTLLEHNLSILPDEIDEVILVVGYLNEKIKEAVGEEYHGKKLKYIVQKELLGTAHALSLCRGNVKGRFLVIMGDDLYNAQDLAEMVKRPLAILVSKLSEEDSRNDVWARVVVDEQGKLCDILERQPYNPGWLVNCGAYVLDDSYFKYSLVPAGNKTSEYGLPQTFLQMVGDGKKIDIVRATFWKKVTTPEDLV
jgi:NDP-sugar pyrophosphorylase family protein